MIVRTISLIALFSLALLSACKKDRAKEGDDKGTKPETALSAAAAPATPAPAAPTGGALPLEAASVSAGSETLKLDATGKVTGDDKDLGTVSADGTFKGPDGAVLATITADGAVTFTGESETITVSPEGTVTAKGAEVLSIGADGKLAGLLTKETGPMTYQGSPAARRTMMFVWLSVSMKPGKAPARPTDAPH